MLIELENLVEIQGQTQVILYQRSTNLATHSIQDDNKKSLPE